MWRVNLSWVQCTKPESNHWVPPWWGGLFLLLQKPQFGGNAWRSSSTQKAAPCPREHNPAQLCSVPCLEDGGSQPRPTRPRCLAKGRRLTKASPAVALAGGEWQTRESGAAQPEPHTHTPHAPSSGARLGEPAPQPSSRSSGRPAQSDGQTRRFCARANTQHAQTPPHTHTHPHPHTVGSRPHSSKSQMPDAQVCNRSAYRAGARLIVRHASFLLLSLFTVSTRVHGMAKFDRFAVVCGSGSRALLEKQALGVKGVGANCAPCVPYGSV